jgi:hypothetical protein
LPIYCKHLQKYGKIADNGLDDGGNTGLAVRNKSNSSKAFFMNDKNKSNQKGLTYADSGVDIDAGNAFVEAIKPHIRNTRRSGVMGSIGGFGGLFDLAATGYKDPVLVAANDGVGTKVSWLLKPAFIIRSASIWLPCASMTLLFKGRSLYFFWTISQPVNCKAVSQKKLLEGLPKAAK